MSFNLEQANSGFASYTSAGLAIGTNSGTFKTTNTLTYTNNGVFKSKSATDNLAFSSGHTALGNNQACLFGVWIDTSGNVTTSQGPIVAAGDPCPVPSAPAANLSFVGYIKVSTGAAQTFTPGTSVLGTGNTATYANCARVPGTAQ